jgi:hypothetical protein
MPIKNFLLKISVLPKKKNLFKKFRRHDPLALLNILRNEK